MLEKTATALQAPLQPVHYPNAAWEKIGIDIVGMFVQSFFVQASVCNYLDSGVLFCSDELRLLLRNYGIRHTRNSLYYPQANGEVERFNGVLMDCMQAADAAQEGRVDAVERMLTEYRWTAH
ncbi:hypothetical protein M513_09287 [Trichuris suis]|uniref:Integrase catalytic domain-containing protein n=1 Tax=Trichuris suis TaxID=68888 RepID=A0A085LXX4_9BILA|nr:hypothetical protein M513_09287 [Trichuris suis]